jgi:hypothetical protein
MSQMLGEDIGEGTIATTSIAASTWMNMCAIALYSWYNQVAEGRFSEA